MSQKFMIFFKCHRNLSKQTNPFKVDDLVTNKSVEILEACRRISVLANVKNFYRYCSIDV